MKVCRAWREEVIIPTYEIGKEEKNPIFLENRVYQGSSGVVYPYPVVESVSDKKTDHTYHAIYLENEYLKIMVLPELGGRIQMAYDKIKQRHFIYYNQVIKPALVGLAGPWISGGIEFNWPQHHRPSTFLPVDNKIEENEDGSVTVWVNERERMFHQKGTAGFTLRPGCAYLEIKGFVSNPTDMPQTFLWWANPAVAVNDDYQSVFPPDVNAVFDHGKRAVSSFPIATGTYYKMDYSKGVDISNYKNIFVPTSYMVAKSKYDFEGGYENDTHGGMLHVANHRLAPGKKQWTWGNGDFGRAWDRNLTDEEVQQDGTKRFVPYIELMAGVFTENQPDFTWLKPYEEKSFVQYFMPYRELGIVKNASKDFILNITEQDFKVFATSKQNVNVVVKIGDQIIYNKEVEISPEHILEEHIRISNDDFQHISIAIIKNGKTALDWKWEAPDTEIPEPAEAALKPEEITTVEQLYLTGLHLEQYRHATWSALDYYEEGIKRDPLDTRCNNAIGLWYLRRGRFYKAESYLRTAVKVLMKRNPNPYSSEPLYNLGLCLRYQALQEMTTKKDSWSTKLSEAYDWFYKSTWDGAWQDAGFFACAQISSMQGRFEDALEEINKSLIRNWHNSRARALKAMLLKTTHAAADILNAFVKESLSIDHFNYGVMYVVGMTEEIRTLMHGSANNYNELALDFWNAGFYEDAERIWTLKKEDCKNDGISFPNRLEDIFLLKDNADYNLGCLFYDKRQYDLALSHWECAAKTDPDNPQVHRCLALISYNKLHDAARALKEMETAFHLDESDSRIFMELDQLYKKLGKPHDERLALYERHAKLIEQRDDLLLEYITLLNFTDNFRKAQTLIDNHQFHPWEGGEGKVPAQYRLARIGLAINENCDNEQKCQLLKQCLTYPHNLGEGMLYGAQDNDIHYLLGCYGLKEHFSIGTKGPIDPAPALYYNDAKPDMIFYVGLCHLQLGNIQEGVALFEKLISFGELHLNDKVTMDYFAVSLPDLQVWDGDLNQMNKVHCMFMMALGHLGMFLRNTKGGFYQELNKAKMLLSEAEKLDSSHIGIRELRIIMAWD